MSEKRLMKGNEALAEATIRCGCDAFFGYPITPQSEIIETLMTRRPWLETGMEVLQTESEIASINMVYGAAGCGKKVMTSSASPGMSLMQEGISYMAGANIPCVIVNVMRGGPGLGAVYPAQSDYSQAMKGGGHGDYRLLVLAPCSAQEMHDFVPLGFELAFKYRIPTMIFTDGIIGQMMEKVELAPAVGRLTDEEVFEKTGDWATHGKPDSRKRNIVTSLGMGTDELYHINLDLQKKYRELEKEEVRYETLACDDAEYLLVAYGSSARISMKVVELARAEGLKVGLLRPITLFPFPSKILNEMSSQVKAMLSVELSAGQMMEDIRLAVNGQTRVEHFGTMGGKLFSPEDVLEALRKIV